MIKNIRTLKKEFKDIRRWKIFPYSKNSRINMVIIVDLIMLNMKGHIHTYKTG